MTILSTSFNFVKVRWYKNKSSFEKDNSELQPSIIQVIISLSYSILFEFFINILYIYIESWYINLKQTQLIIDIFTLRWLSPWMKNRSYRSWLTSFVSANTRTKWYLKAQYTSFYSKNVIILLLECSMVLYLSLSVLF